MRKPLYTKDKNGQVWFWGSVDESYQPKNSEFFHWEPTTKSAKSQNIDLK